ASIASASSARRSSGSRCFASSPRNGMTIDGTVKDTIEVSASGNAALADRLESFAALLELADAQYHAVRAYRRAAEVIRSTPAPVAELVRAGRAQELRGIGPGIEGRLRELVETGDIQELADLERELAPDLIGLGRLLGVGAKRGVEIGRALGISTLDEFREAAEQGRLREVPGIGPETERKLVVAPRERLGTELLRATGSEGYVAALEPLPDGADEESVYAALEIPFCPPELREHPFRDEPPSLVTIDDIRGDLHCHTTWSDGRERV